MSDGYRPESYVVNPAPPPRNPGGGNVKVLKEGTPITLHGECYGCHTIVETDTKEARKYQIPNPSDATVRPKVHFEVTCPICATPFEVNYRGPGCPDRGVKS